jgi:hypothetical protein
MVSALPKPNTQFPGANCLLCIAVAEANHSKLTTQVQSLGTKELEPLKAELVKLLQQRGVNAVAIEAPFEPDKVPDRKDAAEGQSRKDFSAFKTQQGLDRVLVVHLQAVGVWRSYSAYFPQSAPRAIVQGSGYLVDLSTHKLEWLKQLDISRASEGEWDEPPKFAGLTNAYYQALEAALDQLRKPFVR